MRNLLLLVMAVVLVGCATSGRKLFIKNFPAGLDRANELYELLYPPAKPFVNTLGMKFVSVPGTDVQFSIWETRVKDYAAYAAANEGVDEGWKKPGGFKQEDTHPVVRVSWNNAQAFCAWLTKKELASGKLKAEQRYRLPTDAEWSVAVGLGKETGNTPEEKSQGIVDVYPWGKEWPPPKGAGNYSSRMKVEKFEFTSPVGSFTPNRHSIYDLGGNVWEWCEDEYNSASNVRVLRGTSWWKSYFTRGYLWSSFRNHSTGSFEADDRGFRCVLAGE